MNPFFMPQGPPPIWNQQTRYVYRTRDGGPPDMGKPPSMAGAPPPPPPPPYSPFGFGAPMPGTAPPPPTGPFGFSIPQPQIPGPPPGCQWAYQPPPAPPGGPPAPAPMGFPSAAPMAFNPASYQGPVYPTGSMSNGNSNTGAPAPGNRINERVVKIDDGTSVLLSPDQTCFHVLEPGQRFSVASNCSPPPSMILNVHYKVQYADSDWSIDKVIELLGGKKMERTGRAYFGQDSLVGIQQWHEGPSGVFTEGTLFMLNDPRSKQTLREVSWGPEHGRAGQKPPIWVMLYPVKEYGD